MAEALARLTAPESTVAPLSVMQNLRSKLGIRKPS
jgi:hypothetical protein